MSQIKVLVVDDSFFIRKRLVDMLNSEPEIDVVDTAENGLEAIEKIARLRPDVVTLDIEMPNMDGLTALVRIMKENPTPVIMVSTLTEIGSEATMNALLRGAVDFIHKPTSFGDAKLYNIKEEIVAKVKIASRARLRFAQSVLAKTTGAGDVVIRAGKNSDKLVLIGSSTGGPRALLEVLPRLPKNFPAPIAIVQHMPPGPFIKSISRRLEADSQISVSEANHGDKLEPGRALIAPGGYHMLIEKGHVVRLNQGPSVNSVRPSVDVMMSSAAAVYGSNIIGVVLTGMGHDGADGMTLIKKKGGRTIAEDQSTCIVYGMSRSVIEKGDADRVVPIDGIAAEIVKML